jgi:hypothetical protein
MTNEITTSLASYGNIAQCADPLPITPIAKVQMSDFTQR